MCAVEEAFQSKTISTSKCRLEAPPEGHTTSAINPDLVKESIPWISIQTFKS